jgi:hypothetical protein
MRTLSFRQLLDSFMGAARRAPSEVTAGSAEETQFGADLNAAARWLWVTETHSMALPDMMTGKTVTLGTGGVIAATAIEDADFWSVWSVDPRTKLLGSREALQLPATALGNGDVAVHDKKATDTVYVLYKSPVPRWTTTRVIDVTTYAAAALVWWEGVIVTTYPPDGHVYLNINPSGFSTSEDITDTGTWAKVTLPQSLEDIIVKKANYERLRLGTNMPENAGRERAELVAAVDAAFLAAAQVVSNKPWLYNQNQ